VARDTGTPLWEAFAFPCHDQMARLRGLLAGGAIGELRQIQPDFHFLMWDPATTIRMPAELAGRRSGPGWATRWIPARALHRPGTASQPEA